MASSVKMMLKKVTVELKLLGTVKRRAVDSFCAQVLSQFRTRPIVMHTELPLYPYLPALTFRELPPQLERSLGFQIAQSDAEPSAFFCRTCLMLVPLDCTSSHPLHVLDRIANVFKPTRCLVSYSHSVHSFEALEYICSMFPAQIPAITKAVCIGCPSVHEELVSRRLCESTLIDVDGRFGAFFRSFYKFDMLHFGDLDYTIDSHVATYSSIEPILESCWVIIISLHYVPMATMKQNWQALGVEISFLRWLNPNAKFLLLLPYLMKTSVSELMPNLRMLDYRVSCSEYDGYGCDHVHSIVGYNESMRIFTDFTALDKCSGGGSGGSSLSSWGGIVDKGSGGSSGGSCGGKSGSGSSASNGSSGGSSSSSSSSGSSAVIVIDGCGHDGDGGRDGGGGGGACSPVPKTPNLPATPDTRPRKRLSRVSGVALSASGECIRRLNFNNSASSSVSSSDSSHDCGITYKCVCGSQLFVSTTALCHICQVNCARALSTHQSYFVSAGVRVPQLHSVTMQWARHRAADRSRLNNTGAHGG
jgi:hypothetical protein